ncbi:MAG: amidase [Stellaceae bacterium]
MASEPLHYFSLMDISAKVKSRELKPTTLTEAILKRIARHDGMLKSYTTLLADRAMTKAKEAESELDRGFWRGPLHGVPIAVKDLCYTDYAPTAAGMFIHKDRVPPYTCTVVERLERAGGIILGKLTMTEGAFATHHPNMPTPINPWNSEVWTGVSSSGSGSATAAGLCYGSLGSDTGGSIRFPSAACGLTGLKPTWGRVSRYGVCPLSESLDHIGPMARTAADCAAILAAMAGADPRDPTALLAPVLDYVASLEGGLRGLRVGIDEAYAFNGLSEEVLKALSAARDALVALGARLVPIDFPSTSEAATAWGHLCLVETTIAHEATYPSRAAEYGPGLGGFLAGAGGVGAMDLGKAQIVRGKFLGQVGEAFQDIDVMLIPVIRTPSPTPAEWLEMLEGDIAQLLRYTAEFNLTGMPTITMNGGFDKRGAPIGFQLVGKHLSEDLLLRAGHAFQSITDWHTRHPPLD